MEFKIGDRFIFKSWIGEWYGEKCYGPISRLENLYIEFTVVKIITSYKGDLIAIEYDSSPVWDYWRESHHNCAYINVSFFEKKEGESNYWITPITMVQKVEISEFLLNDINNEIHDITQLTHKRSKNWMLLK